MCFNSEVWKLQYWSLQELVIVQPLTEVTRDKLQNAVHKTSMMPFTYTWQVQVKLPLDEWKVWATVGIGLQLAYTWDWQQSNGARGKKYSVTID